MPCQYFVYGTLQRGRRYESVWPCQPVSVRTAWVLGRLFDGPDYPAMKAGDDRVLGELWTFDESQCQLVTQALDRLEGTDNNSPDDLYHRLVAEVFNASGEWRDDSPHHSLSESFGPATVYHFVRDPLDHGFQRLTPNDDNFVRWPTSLE